MNMKIIVSGVVGFAIGGIIGSILTRKKCEKEYDESFDEVYNKCYEDARKEFEEEQKMKYEKEYKRCITKYKKPDLRDLEMERYTMEEALAIEEANMDDVEDDLEIPENPDGGLISEHDFYNDYPNYRKADIFYYIKDEVFTNEDDDPIEDTNDIFDELRVDIKRFLRSSERVYLRDCKLETDFIIYRLNGAYSEFQFETPKEREKRLTKRILNLK